MIVSPGYSTFYTKKSDYNYITEILFKVAINTPNIHTVINNRG